MVADFGRQGDVRQPLQKTSANVNVPDTFLVCGRWRWDSLQMLVSCGRCGLGLAAAAGWQKESRPGLFCYLIIKSFYFWTLKDLWMLEHVIIDSLSPQYLNSCLTERDSNFLKEKKDKNKCLLLHYDLTHACRLLQTVHIPYMLWLLYFSFIIICLASGFARRPHLGYNTAQVC